MLALVFVHHQVLDNSITTDLLKNEKMMNEISQKLPKLQKDIEAQKIYKSYINKLLLKQ
jgi:hypothetical protein